MERHKVDVYICGHDHNLQHLRHVDGDGLDFIVCGGGGAVLYGYNSAHAQELKQVSWKEIQHGRTEMQPGHSGQKFCDGSGHVTGQRRETDVFWPGFAIVYMQRHFKV